MRKNLLLMSVSMLLFACTSSKNLEKNLSRERLFLPYLTENISVKCDKNVKIALGAVRLDSIAAQTKVYKNKKYVLPLLFYNGIDEEMWVRLGQNSYEQLFPDYFADVFFQQSESRGCYTLVDNAKDADYVIDFNIVNYNTEAKYSSSSSTLFLFWELTANKEETAFGANTSIDVRMRLTAKNGIRFEKTVYADDAQPLYEKTEKDFEKLQFFFQENMVKSLSAATKQCAEQIVGEINNRLKLE
ncbi:MAG: YidC/Oxa1 family insertase periplasmic domain-containing protein [Dysgonamonadaceae bacterium]|nr:YidC/Oxa1 family insertase periplasmic domain-containing protein [Dysgonamonadaceae bacterium]